MSQPRVGIVVRTKNRSWFLRRALNDIAAQDYSAWRAVVVNDGGDPAAVEAVLAGLPSDISRRVDVLHNEHPHGRSAAANEGLRAVNTEFVVLHDDDDLWTPTFLSETVRWLDEHDDDVGVMARTEIVYEVQRGDGYVAVDRAAFWPQLSAITYSDLLQVNRAVPICFLYRRAIHDEVGFYREDLHAVEDWDFYLRLTLRHHIALLDGPPLAFWMQRASASGDDGNSMFVLAGEHEKYDKMVRDEALRAYVAAHGPGLPLYLTHFIQEEVERQLHARHSLASLVVSQLRRWRYRRRSR